jgi:hypothetical protein
MSDWFQDRKDELDEAARIGRGEQDYWAGEAKAKARKITH